jgi:hypothetical protein
LLGRVGHEGIVAACGMMLRLVFEKIYLWPGERTADSQRE